MPPPMLPATRRMPSSSPLKSWLEAMFSRKEVGNLFTLDWVVCRAAREVSDSMVVMPMASTENTPMRKKSPKNRFHPRGQQIS